ncbi:MAG: SPOR domain-containing protein [Flavobacteriaceae bacterium]|nr:SPOR domain-containing protein [Flavobacteriaceae bacterium]
MPFIEESDLLALHKDVEKAQIINDRLLDQVRMKDKEIMRSRKHRNIFAGITVFFLVVMVVVASYTFGASSVLKRFAQADGSGNQVFVSMDSIIRYEDKLQTLEKENSELSVLKEFYLAKEFLEGELVYAVQVKSLKSSDINLADAFLLNSVFVKDNAYLSYSLGVFRTLEEARELRKNLVKLGFEDAFVASYKSGKRLKIEDPY